MLFLIFAGVVAGLCGVMLLIAPGTLAKINSVVNKILFDVDAWFYKGRIAAGILMCLLSAVFFFMAYYLSLRFGIR